MDTAQHPLLFGDVTVVDRQLLGLSEREAGTAPAAWFPTSRGVA
jgi:hypothetical protein